MLLKIVRHIGILFIFLSPVISKQAFSRDNVTINLGDAEPQVQFVFDGRLYDKNSDETIHELLNDEHAKAIVKIIDANSSKEPSAILATWIKSERGKIISQVSDAKLLEKNSAFFRNILSSKMIAVVNYGGYSIVYVSHKVLGMDKPFTKSYPLKSEGEELLLSNELADDVFFNQLGKAVIESLCFSILKSFATLLLV